MPELTRLRRHIRDYPEDVWADTQTLLDALDIAYEDLSSLESELKWHHSLERESMLQTITEQPKQIAKALCEMTGFGPYSVLEVLIDHLGWDAIERELEEHKRKMEFLARDDSLGDLDDHPF